MPPKPSMSPASLHTLQRLYDAFAVLDATTMARCYAEQAQFSDPVFTLQGRQAIAAMWRMLCTATQAEVQRHGPGAWALQAHDLHVEGTQGRAAWQAQYRFPATGRRVHNRISATFRFDADGLIVQHHDRFSLWTWSRQALGPSGALLGWTPWLQARVRRQAAQGLQRFRQRNG